MNRQSGGALIVTVVLIMIMAAMTASLLLLVMGNTRTMESNVHLARAFYIAEAGIERKVAQMNNNNDDNLEAEFGGGIYEVEVISWETDGEDNNNDGIVDDSGERNYYTIASLGEINERQRKIEAIAQKEEGTLPNVYGAIQLYNPIDPETGEVIPGSLVNFSGNVPRVTGQDTNIPEGDFSSIKDRDATIGDGPGGNVLAIATNDDQSVADILEAASSPPSNPDRIDGLDVTDPNWVNEVQNPSEGTDVEGNSAANCSTFDELNAIKVRDLANEYKTYAAPEDVYTTANPPAGGDEMGTLDNPKVSVIETGPNETIHINGDISGSGILVIDGNVRFGGTFNFAGLVIITSNGTAEVDLRGTPLIFGSIIAANPDPGETEPTLLDIRGTADVYYSTEGLSKATNALSGTGAVTLIMYKEVSAKL